MSDTNKSTHWEEVFIQEALELEEKMKTEDVGGLNKSKLRICLEQKILDWPQYEKWYMSQRQCSSLKASIDQTQLQLLLNSAKEVHSKYKQYDFWGPELIPLVIWDKQLIVMGLQYNEKLLVLGEHIFILAPPDILHSFFEQSQIENNQDEKTVVLQTVVVNAAPIELVEEQSKVGLELKEISEDSAISEALEGINLNQAAPKITFTLTQSHSAPVSAAPIAATTQAAPPPTAPQEAAIAAPSVRGSPSVFATSAAQDATDQVWDFISERHQEYSFEVKKQFDAFVILKISNKKTQVFKLDADLTRQGVNPMIFEYNLENEGPFKKIYEGKRSDAFSMKQLEMYLADYQHACITPLVRGEKVLGFFVGFKKNSLSQQDKKLLEELADETAA